MRDLFRVRYFMCKLTYNALRLSRSIMSLSSDDDLQDIHLAGIFEVRRQ